MRKMKLFLMNSIILVITSLLLRTIGVSFNVYISNKIGLSGMGLLEIIISVFSFAVILATSGISLAATRLVAEELASNSNSGINSAMKKCISYSLFFGISSGFLLFFSSNFVGTYLLHDVRTIKSLYVLSICLPFIAIQSALYGYFTAVRRIAISASVQIIEQVVKIALTIYLLKSFLPKGLEYACLSLVIASCISEIVSFILLFCMYIIDKRRFTPTCEKSENMTNRMLNISLPIAFSSYICSALYTIKSVMIPIGLIKSGMTRDIALAQFGVISGMVLPVILFPSAFLSAFSSLIVPEITECYRLGNTKKINYIISRAFQITLIFSIGIIGIFLKFPYDFGMVIFRNIEIGSYIRVLAPLILIIYLDSVVDSMLKGLNQQVSSMFYNIFDSAFSIILVYFLLPKYGIKGLMFVIFLSKLLNTFLSVNKIIKVTNFKIDFLAWFVKPLFCILFSISLSKIFVDILNIGYNSLVFALILSVVFSLVLYIITLWFTNCFSKSDILRVKSIFKK